MEETKPWTSIDFYYKGFHVKKSVPQSYTADKIIKIVKKYEKLGFEPSWNTDTNKKVRTDNDPIMKATESFDNQDTRMCPIHHVSMTAKDGKFGKFYSHKEGEGWCNGK